MVHVIPLYEQDMESHSLNVSASVSGVRLGGGMNYTEALLHRFGILGPDGGSGTGLHKGWANLQKGPLSKLFNTTPLIVDNSDVESMREGKETSFPHLKKPDDVDVTIELRDWLFALEGAQKMAERWWFSSLEDVGREERCWHTTFRSLRVNAKSSPKNAPDGKAELHRVKQNPVELVTVGIERLRILKPHIQKDIPSSMSIANGDKEYSNKVEGIGLGVRLILCEDKAEDEMVNWQVEDVKFSVKQPIEAAVTKDELQHLTFLCKSEIDSIGRITAGILRLLKLEGSVGQAVIDQLSNLGSEGIDMIFFSDKVSRDGSAGSRGLPPLPNQINERPHKTMEQTLTLLEEAVLDSQAKLNDLITDVGASESSSLQHVTIVKLSQKIETMHGLLMQLRNQL